MVIGAADVEVCPLGNWASATDTTGIGLQEVCLVQRSGIGNAAKNDEEHEDDRASNEDEGRQAHSSAY